MVRLGLILCIVAGLVGLATCGTTAADDANKADEGWTQLFNGKDLTGWKTYPEGTGKWRVEDGILIGSGPVSHLFSERGDYTNFHYLIEARINEGGNSGQYFRTQFGGGYPKGYEAQINSTHRDPVKTGSLYGFGEKNIVRDILVKPDEWFTQEVIAAGNNITIKVNGKTTVVFEDPKNTHTKGHFALQQHHEGSVVQFRKIAVKELPSNVDK